LRMDGGGGIPARYISNSYDTDALVGMFVANGESRFARRIAQGIGGARPVVDTLALADIVTSAIPAPARRRGALHRPPIRPDGPAR